MAGKRERKKPTKKKRGNSKSAHVVEEHMEELSDRNDSDDLCEPAKVKE